MEDASKQQEKPLKEVDQEGQDEDGSEDQDQTLQTIDTCFNYCFDHLLDISSFVRCKALDILEKLVNEGKSKLEHTIQILKLTTKKLLDESVLVRKKAIRLCSSLIKNQRFLGSVTVTLRKFKIFANVWINKK